MAGGRAKWAWCLSEAWPAVFAGPGKMVGGRAKWGAGGTLHRQSALAGPNSIAEVWVLRTGRGKRR